MSRRIYIGLVFILVIGLAYFFFSFKEKQDDGLVKLAPSPTIDMGTLRESEVKSKVLSLVNLSREAIEIEEIETPCGCAVVELDRDVIEPGEAGALTVSLKSQSRRGPFTSKFNITWKGKKSGRQGLLNGQAKGVGLFVADLLPPYVDFSTVPPDGTLVEKNITVKHGSPELSWETIRVGELPAKITATILYSSKEAAEIKFGIDPSQLDFGPFFAQAKIEFLDSAQHVVEAKSVPIRGQLKSPFLVSPPSFYLGKIELNKVYERSISITSKDGSSFQVTNIKLVPELKGFHYSISEVTPNKSVVIFKLSPEKVTGTLKGHMIVSLTGAKWPATLKVPFLGYVKEE